MDVLRQAVSHHQAGRLKEAEQLYRAILKIQPAHPDANHNLGVLAGQVGQHAAGLPFLKTALAINPAQGQYALSYAEALLATGQMGEAQRVLQAAMRRGLNTPAAKALRQKAEAAVLNAPEKKTAPTPAEINQLGALFNAGRYAEVENQARLLLEQYPNSGFVWKMLGVSLEMQDKEALPVMQKATELFPNDAETHNNLGNVLQALKQNDEAVASFRRALEIKPDFALAHYNLSNALLALGQLDDAAASYRRALEIKPDYADAHSNLLFCLSHSEATDARTLFAEHRRFGEQFESPLQANWPQHSNSRDPDRPLRVGFVSGDLRAHVVATFIEPVLARLADHPQLSLYAYYNHAVEDAVSQRLKLHLTHWRAIAVLSDEALTQKIQEDGIDILIDLSGHTALNRLPGFAHKPAPLQVSWIGYPGTTGLKAMDYYLADRFFLPPGQFDDQFTEKLVHMPAVATFLPFDDAPPVNALPALDNGYVTFGSFNRLSKLNPSVIALWSQLLRELPNARMVLGAMPQAGENDMLIDWFAREGIARERLSFYSNCPMKDFLYLHHQVDICLDAFPYSGGTTSCHALWMGVPTLTLTGNTPASRVGATWLNQVGLEAFVAHDKTEFVEKGLYWAGHLAELANIRDGLRVRFGQSALGQPDTVSAALESALRTMWQRWCAGLPAESFAVLQQASDKPTQAQGAES